MASRKRTRAEIAKHVATEIESVAVKRRPDRTLIAATTPEQVVMDALKPPTFEEVVAPFEQAARSTLPQVDPQSLMTVLDQAERYSAEWCAATYLLDRRIARGLVQDIGQGGADPSIVDALAVKAFQLGQLAATAGMSALIGPDAERGHRNLKDCRKGAHATARSEKRQRSDQLALKVLFHATKIRQQNPKIKESTLAMESALKAGTTRETARGVLRKHDAEQKTLRVARKP